MELRANFRFESSSMNLVWKQNALFTCKKLRIFRKKKISLYPGDIIKL